MKLDTRALRYLNADDWRVLAAVEQGSKNHEVVPTPLIQQIAGLRGSSGLHKNISNLAKANLIGKVKNARYDGYRLTYGGLDYLALNAHRRAGAIYSLGNQIGVGKESDIYVTADSGGRQQVLKLHRLGRISFRSVKSNRDYLRNRSTGSWMYLSRLSAQKEHAFMRVLHREGFPVPEPIAWNRHTVVMEFIDALPLRMIESVPEPGKLYAELMDMIIRLAGRGLIHGDFNEFNILIKEVEKDDNEIDLIPILIDFPQTISTNHMNAQMYFDRDIECVKRYFERRFKYVCDDAGPHFIDAIKAVEPTQRLDIEVEASGFSKKMAKELERYVEATGSDHEEVGDTEADDTEETEDGSNEQLRISRVEEKFGENDRAGYSKSDDHDEYDQLVAKFNRSTDLELIPLELSHDPDVVAEKSRTMKKAAGWAI